LEQRSPGRQPFHKEPADEVMAIPNADRLPPYAQQQESRVLDATGREDEQACAHPEFSSGPLHDSEPLDALAAFVDYDLNDSRVDKQANVMRRLHLPEVFGEVC
jgi:hypothetical protein